MTAAFCLYGIDLIPYKVMRDLELFLSRLPCSPALQEVLVRATRYDPGARYNDAGEFTTALLAASQKSGNSAQR